MTYQVRRSGDVLLTDEEYVALLRLTAVRRKRRSAVIREALAMYAQAHGVRFGSVGR